MEIYILFANCFTYNKLKMDPLDTDRECCRAMKRKMLNTQNDLEKRMREMDDSMKRQMMDLQRKINKVNESLMSLLDYKNTKHRKTMFPLQTEDDVCEMDRKVAESPSEFVDIFRRMLMPEGLTKNLERVLSSELLMKFNFTGTVKMMAFDKFVHLNNAMYEAIKEDDLSFVEYTKEVRVAFFKIKNRLYKSRQRHRTEQYDN
ncbi:uncharacterized protein LOC117568428 isoform X2 [Drosophila albomicans]|uniref:Uncharacterized protein LOC117568428 isoform X2 n=1 Tax=Drosophila albomicans TaxID=7291 RepID=A0A9C6T4X3_DROAB|nr:uncharacterized protein LOC117568428 isoform X2 [Drosophila albomicans]